MSPLRQSLTNNDDVPFVSRRSAGEESGKANKRASPEHGGGEFDPSLWIVGAAMPLLRAIMDYIGNSALRSDNGDSDDLVAKFGGFGRAGVGFGSWGGVVRAKDPCLWVGVACSAPRCSKVTSNNTTLSRVLPEYTGVPVSSKKPKLLRSFAM